MRAASLSCLCPADPGGVGSGRRADAVLAAASAGRGGRPVAAVARERRGRRPAAADLLEGRRRASHAFKSAPRASRSAQVFGIDVDGLRPGDERTFDGARARLPARIVDRPAAGRIHGAGAAAQVRDVPPRHRPHGQAADGSRRGPAVEQPHRGTSTARRRRLRWDGAARRSIRIELDKVIPPIAAAGGHEVRQACAHQERAALEVLGPRHAPGRARPAPRGIRHASRTHAIRSSSTTATSRATSADGARRRRIRTSSASTANASTSIATTASSSRPRTTSTRSGPGPTFPRALMIEIQHANPYYDDSYAVNSANLGPMATRS